MLLFANAPPGLLTWVLSELQHPLVIFGFAAQFIFFARFLVQWVVSERLGRSHIPVSFWYLSLVGGAMTFVYALLKHDLVFMTSQGLAVGIYIRNLMLIYRPRPARLVDGAPLTRAERAVADSAPP
ncbi:MAG: lipid-A-disaccharide synthase N-terminal domain-containing protein [Phycisphaerales bacterium]|nr:lipid-A-disaccharide synthase N-terminal domain-containing protein [Phycisphaerales bacterium]